MTFIDWSDGEGMFGLLVDFVADEMAGARQDPDRCRFLADLHDQLQSIERALPHVPPNATNQRLRDLRDSIDSEFSGDPVVGHLDDCIDGLEGVDPTR